MEHRLSIFYNSCPSALLVFVKNVLWNRATYSNIFVRDTYISVGNSSRWSSVNQYWFWKIIFSLSIHLLELMSVMAVYDIIVGSNSTVNVGYDHYISIMCSLYSTVRIWVTYVFRFLSIICVHISTGEPLYSRALAHIRAPLFTQPCPHCSHSRAPGEQWTRLCVFTL